MQVIIPVINWLEDSVPRAPLAIIIIFMLTLLPTLCLPSAPFVWLCGIVFGYGIGMVIMTIAIFFGMRSGNRFSK